VLGGSIIGTMAGQKLRGTRTAEKPFEAHNDVFANAPSDPNHQIGRGMARRADLEHPEPIMVCTVSIVLIHYFHEPLFALRCQVEYLPYLAIELIGIHAL
jgi:hypothetical protein